MPNLILGNVNNENMVGEIWRLTYEKKCFSSVVANRFLWTMNNGDAILLPYRPSELFLQYVFDLIGVDPQSIHIVLPPGSNEDTTLLTFDVLSSPDILDSLRTTIQDPLEWTVTPYYFDRASAWLIEQLAIPLAPGVLNYFRQGGAEQFNSKAEFRRLSAAHDIPVAKGTVCSSTHELEMAIHEFMITTGSVIIKQDFSAGCKGNVVVTSNRSDTSVGAFETIFLETPEKTSHVAQKIWEEMTGARNVLLIVEVYHPLARAYYTELEIPIHGRRPYLLNFGEMRMNPIWIGFEIPCTTLAPYQLSDLLTLSMKLGDVAQSMGFTGKMSCDAICTQEGDIYFNEINGRLGGCTPIHILATHLLGPHYGNNYTLFTRNRVDVGIQTFHELLENLQVAQLLYTQEQDAGVVIISEDTERTHTIEYMVIASDHVAAQKLEEKMLEILREKKS